MQGIIYDQDVEQLDKLLQLYKTYYIGNAKIKEITSNAPIFASAKYQMLLNRSTNIRLASEEEQLPINHAYQLTPFAQCPAFADVSTKQINLLCSVVHVFPPRFVEKTKRNLQEFVIVNEERKPLILTLWEEFLQTETPFLTQNVHTFPVILGMRLSVNTFYGLSIGTVPNSTILFDPPIQRSDLLKRWLQTNQEYIEAVVSQKLYDKENQEIDQPFSSHIRKISQILSLHEVKSFWIKAKIRIKNPEDSVYFLACPGCSKSCGAAYKYEFSCFYCNHDFPSPKPLLQFQAELFDGTGNLTAFIENKEASMLLCASGEDMIEAEENRTPFTPEIFNEKSKELPFLFQLRTSWSKTRGKTFVRNTVIACLPAAESSSTSHSYEHKSSASKVLRLTQDDVAAAESQENVAAAESQENVAAAESQESSSAIQEEHCETDLRAQQCKPPGKRKLAHEEVLHESTKYMKQD
ncbi:replication protein A 70 kDa DNA-binding subunit B-like isoform X2 [Primulina tabacum]|uniref:replication protein A 70 kDa DNA-binding subunit B-like isoform X2 n=1 Tax=Primulina tabacum TaxID=48773 RepID=UPI003F591718